MRIPVVVMTGPVGVGKSSVAAAMSEILAKYEVDHALIDLDSIRWCYPAPAEDRFHTRLGLRNLAAVASNYRAAGAGRLILVDVVEMRGQTRDYEDAIPRAEVTVVRLRAALDTIRRRLEGRESGASLEWHRNRAGELSEIMERERIGDLVIETEGKAIMEVAREALTRVRWLE